MPKLSSEYCESISRSLEFLRAEYASAATNKADARWKLISVSKTNGLETATLQNADAEFVTVRGRLHFPGITPAQVLRLIHDCPNRTAWDDMLQEGKFVREYGALKTALLPECSADIIRLIYKGMLTVSGRDLCLLRAWGEDEDGTCWLVAESCEDDAASGSQVCSSRVAGVWLHHDTHCRGLRSRLHLATQLQRLDSLFDAEHHSEAAARELTEDECCTQGQTCLF